MRATELCDSKDNIITLWFITDIKVNWNRERQEVTKHIRHALLLKAKVIDTLYSYTLPQAYTLLSSHILQSH